MRSCFFSIYFQHFCHWKLWLLKTLVKVDKLRIHVDRDNKSLCIMTWQSLFCFQISAWLSISAAEKYLFKNSHLHVVASFSKIFQRTHWTKIIERYFWIKSIVSMFVLLNQIVLSKHTVRHELLPIIDSTYCSAPCLNICYFIIPK